MKRLVNRTQLLLVGFFLCVWIGFLAVLVLSPGVYAQSAGLGQAQLHTVEVPSFLAITVLIAVVVIGILGRWRWMFWALLIVFLLGILRIPASILQVGGLLPASGPVWYEVVQGVIGAVQFAIALAMWAGCRKAGPWGDFAG